MSDMPNNASSAVRLYSGPRSVSVSSSTTQYSDNSGDLFIAPSESCPATYCSIKDQEINNSNCCATYNKKITFFIVLSASSFIVSLILSGFVLYIFVNNNWRPDKQEAKNDITCLWCDDLDANYFSSFGFKRIIKNGKQFCCATNASQFEKLLEQYVDRKLLENTNARPVCRNVKGSNDSCQVRFRPAAHLLGTYQQLGNDLKLDLSNEIPIKKWISNSNLAFTQGVHYNSRDGRIVISAAGYYMIYSHVTFIEYFDIGEGRHGRKRYTSHSIYRYNRRYPNGGDERFLQERQTKCWSNRTEYEFHASHLSGVFYLRKGDEIFVKVSNISCLSREPYMTNFGLFMVTY